MTTPITHRTTAPFAWRIVQRGAIPSGPGVYAVYVRGELVYVGSSSDLRSRARLYFRKARPVLNYDEHDDRPPFETPWGHRHDGRDVVVKVKASRRYADWLMIEARLIRRLRPCYNAAHAGRSY